MFALIATGRRLRCRLQRLTSVTLDLEVSCDEYGRGRRTTPSRPRLPETAAPLASSSVCSRRCAQAEERARSHWEQYLRAVAELDNVRKRAQRDIEAPIATAWRSSPPSCCRCGTAWSSRCRTPARRDARSLHAGPGGHAAAARQGLREARHRGASTRWASRSIRRGTRRCWPQESRTRASPNSVLQVVQPGYELNGRLLRPARVIVAQSSQRCLRRRSHLE